ncbi:MAG TPA: hypothetical protein VF884_11940 [Nitrososphaeraceae archaeon]
MADAPLTYGIVIGTFIFLGGLLFAMRAKYTKIRRALEKKDAKAKGESSEP